MQSKIAVISPGDALPADALIMRTPPRPRIAAAVALVFAIGGAGAAQEIVSAEAFESLAEGRTLYFTHDGQTFGAEQYFSGRRVLWMFADGACETGRWYQQGSAICFTYEADPTPHCWHFAAEGGSYAAHLLQNGQPAGLTIDLASIDQRPLACPGPDVGS